MGIFRQFPYSNFHDMNMDEIIKIVRNMLDEWVEYNEKWNVIYENVTKAFERFENDFNEFLNNITSDYESTRSNMQTDFDNFIDSINVETEMRKALNSMVTDGTFANAVDPLIATRVSTWLSANITNPTNPPIDNSLMVDHAAANSKVAGFNMDLSTLNTTENGRIHYDYINKRIYTDTPIKVIASHYIDTIPAGIEITQNDIPWSMNLMVWNFSTKQIEFKYPSDPITTFPKNYAIICVIQKSNFSMTSLSNLIDDVQYDGKYEYLNNYNRQSSQIKIFEGDIFITACGTDVFIDSFYGRILNARDLTYHNITSQRLVDAWSSSVRYITYRPDSNDFYASSIFSRYAIAMIRRNWVYPLIDRLHVNYRALQNGYIRPNSSYYINTRRLGYEKEPLIRYDSPDVKLSDHLYKFVQNSTIAYQLTPTEGSTPYFLLNLNTVDITNKKILMIGDSFIARGWLQNWLHQLEPTLSFIGTKTTQNYGYLSEGVSGSRITYFTDLATSPFAFNGSLDFGAYLNYNGLQAPDYVVINTAINTSLYSNNDYFIEMKKIVDMVRNYDPTIKIYIAYGANYAIDAGSIYGYPNRRFYEVRIADNSLYALPNCTIIPLDYVLDAEVDYPKTVVNDMGVDFTILSDCVHPTENQGFRKMANMIYNYIGV